VYYKSWKLVSAEDFSAVHTSVSNRILPYFLPFVVLLVLVNILLIWFHHPAMSTPLIALSAATELLIVVVRIMVFLPIHKQLDKTKSIELIDRLLQYDRYAGIVPAVIVRIATLVLLYQVASASSH
jgi:uncharacterized membrane-anchored protein YitT (DUF2179 family)